MAGHPIEIVREAKSLFGAELLGKPEVHSVGVGLRFPPSGDDYSDELALVVLLDREQPPGPLPEQEVPESVTFTSRVTREEVTVFVTQLVVRPPRQRKGSNPNPCGNIFSTHIRPVPGGYSIGNIAVDQAGTLGGWAWDSKAAQVVLLSAAHVLEPPADLCMWKEGGKAPRAIIQPGRPDADAGGWGPANKLKIASRLEADTDLDVATAVPIPDPNSGADVYSDRVECGGPAIYETMWSAPGLKVVKIGQRTGVSTGIVRAHDFIGKGEPHDFLIKGVENEGHAWDEEGIDPTAFSADGDSGSVVLERTITEGRNWRRAVGVLHSEASGIGDPNDEYSYATEIEEAFKRFGLAPVCTGTISDLIEAILEGINKYQILSEDLSPDIERETGPEAGFRLPDLPAPFNGRWERKRFFFGFPRAFEERIGRSELGERFSALLRRHRVAVVAILFDPDAARAVSVALASFLDGAVTTQDVMEHVITRRDLAMVRRALDRALAVSSQAAPIVEFLRESAVEAEGLRVGQLLFGMEWDGQDPGD